MLRETERIGLHMKISFVSTADSDVCSGDLDKVIIWVTLYADLAHLVERHLAKVEVAGSSPVIRSIKLHISLFRER